MRSGILQNAFEVKVRSIVHDPIEAINDMDTFVERLDMNVKMMRSSLHLDIHSAVVTVKKGLASKQASKQVIKRAQKDAIECAPFRH